MHAWLAKLDRRWIFLMMFVVVGLPILRGWSFPEVVSDKAKTVFRLIEEAPEGSQVLMALDYDPGAEGELAPMSSALTRHCCERRLKIYFVTLWPQGVPIVRKCEEIIRNEYPKMKYGEDYVNLGYKAGANGSIRNAMTNMQEDFVTDDYGRSLQELPMTKGMKNFASVSRLISIGAGSPGPKEWVQLAASPYQLPTIVGSPGVQTPQLLPYVPQQIQGLLGNIKMAAEYEQTLIDRYADLQKNRRAKEGLRRMGPQLMGQLLIVILVLLGNYIYFQQRRRGEVS